MSNYIPSLDVGTGSIDWAKQPKQNKEVPDAKEAIERVDTIRELDKKNTQSLRVTDVGRTQDFGSLFRNENKKYLKKLHKGNGKKFVESAHGGQLNTSFSGVDTKMSISFSGGAPIYIGEAQTVTYSLYRPIEPVYVLGDSRPNGFVRGQRTIAGSVIFTVFDRNVLLNAFYNAYSKNIENPIIDKEYLTDELPPFDIHLTFMNEYGQSAALRIEGCHIPSEGQVHSVEDMITENTIQYVARDITLMRPGDIT